MRDENQFPRHRRHIRKHCRLTIGEKTIDAWTGNISRTGVYLIVPLQDMVPVDVNRGMPVSINLDLQPRFGKMEVEAEVIWKSDEDKEISGRACIGMGMRFTHPTAEQIEMLEKFIEGARYTILMVEKDPVILKQVKEALGENYRVIITIDEAQISDVLQKEDVGVVLVGQHVTDSSGRALVSKFSREIPFMPILILLGDKPQAVEDLELDKSGKFFLFVKKPVENLQLKKIVRQALDMYAMTAEYAHLNKELQDMTKQLEGENQYLKKRFLKGKGFERIVGASDELRKTIAVLERIQSTDVAVHIEGETGTGKELMARALHEGGSRSDRPFLVQNCAGMTETLLQSALFGHRKGSFTGADGNRAGVFQEADRGTLFLDEVAELSPKTQGMLLRVLQYGEVIPVGADQPTKVDVRILSATHKDLKEEVKQNRFREDLFYRLFVVSVKIPSLRERHGDIVLLARHFLELYCARYRKQLIGFSPQAMDLLEGYYWPGNVRELEHEVERAVVLTDQGSMINPQVLSKTIRDSQGASNRPSVANETDSAIIPYDLSFDDAIEKLQIAYIKHALGASGGVINRAAKLLNMERTRLTKLKQRLKV